MKQLSDNSNVEQLLQDALAQGAAMPAAQRQRIWAMARAKARSEAVPEVRHRRRRRLAWVPVFVALLLLGFLSGYGGVVFAEGLSVPGEPFYAIERRAETVWLSLTPHSRRCDVQLVLLERRVYEAGALLDAGRSAPEPLFQEIALIFNGIADGTHCRPQDQAEILPRLITYRDRLAALSARHPGVLGLMQAQEAADAALRAMGVPPREALRSPRPDLGLSPHERAVGF